MRKKLLASVCIALCLTLVSLTGCGVKKKINEVGDGGKSAVDQVADYNKSGKNPLVTIVVKNMGTIKVELYPAKAPQTVYNYISLVNRHFYDGLTFHRIIKNFMVQGGDPKGDGTGGPGYAIRGEFGINGFNYNDIKHERGVISMARNTTPMDSAGSQFFICHKDSPSLDLQYAAFGKVIEGIEVVDKIASVPTEEGDFPVEKVVIEKITVDTFGDTYPEPEKLPDPSSK